LSAGKEERRLSKEEEKGLALMYPLERIESPAARGEGKKKMGHNATILSSSVLQNIKGGGMAARGNPST